MGSLKLTRPLLESVSRATWILTCAIAGSLVVLTRTAWICDDAYITFRTVDNVLHGHGPVWNVDERVQAFTHPLWLAVLSLACWAAREPYSVAIALSLVLSVATLCIFAWRIAPDWPTALLGILALTLSKAFVDFSTSGLENPLSHFLLAVFFAILWTTPPDLRRLSRLAFVGSLVLLTRLDLALLVGPVLLAEAWRVRDWRAVGKAVLAGWPVLGWEAFSLVYYGFPYPNTAYAKLATGIPARELARQGAVYLMDLAHRDRLAFVILAAGIAVAVAVRPRQNWPIAVGIAAYSFYIVSIGGDFMSGRFFTAPVLCAALALARFGLPRALPPRVLAFAVVLGLGLMARRPTLFSGPAYGRWASAIAETGIADERLYYYPATGLLRRRGRLTVPDPDPRVEPLLRQGRSVVLRDDVGHFGYTAGGRLHVVDVLALGDPLLARLPCERPWRIGHYYRRVPEGYLETLATGKNVIRDPGIALLYGQLSVVTRGPLWRSERAAAIYRLLRGDFESELADYKDGFSTAWLSDLGASPRAVEGMDTSAVRSFDRGLIVLMQRSCRGREIDISLDAGTPYQLVFLEGRRQLGAQTVSSGDRAGSLHRYGLAMPEAVQGFDRLRIVPSGGGGHHVLGSVEILE